MVGYIRIACLHYLLIAGSTFACQCEPIIEPKVALERSSATFLGKICGLQRTAETVDVNGDAYAINPNLITFCVEKAWKGVDSDSFDIISGYSSCDYNFEINTLYIVYAVRETLFNDRFYVSKCFPVEKAEEASEDIQALNEMKGEISPKQ
jgi:hypothetical protein